MSDQDKTVHKKPRGRPAGSDLTETIPVRLKQDVASRLDAWAKREGVSRSEAIRGFIDLGLAGASAGRAKRTLASSKSSELAAAQLDKMIDQGVPDEERATRKRRLLKGPSEFREVRKDRKPRQG